MLLEGIWVFKSISDSEAVGYIHGQNVNGLDQKDHLMLRRKAYLCFVVYHRVKYIDKVV